MLDIFVPGAMKMVSNEGMPWYKNPFDKGKLVITFSVSC